MKHHHHSDYVDVVSALGPQQVSGKLKAACIGMMILGFGAFALTAFFIPGYERIGWISFLHNFYLFTGLSAAGVVIAAIIQVARANWGRPIKRYAESMGAFLYLVPIFLAILYFGAPNLYEWIEVMKDPTSEFALFFQHRYHNKSIWLQQDFLFLRQFVMLGIVILLAHKFRSLSTRTDMGVAAEKNSAWPMPSGWAGKEEEVAKGQAAQSKWGVFYCVSYVFGVSLMAYDLIMSLDYRWISTMFGGWNFTTFMLMGWGSLVLITWNMSNRFGVSKYIPKLLYHDLGKLTFGFTVVWGYLFFAQLMVIWYGNLSHETGYLLTRFKIQPWQPISWTVLVLVFLAPFILGLSKKRKMSPGTFAPVVGISLCGIWLERFLLIAPSAWYYDRKAEVFMDGVSLLFIADVVVFIGFLGLWLLMFTTALYKRPVMVISDPRLDLGINRH